MEIYYIDHNAESVSLASKRYCLVLDSPQNGMVPVLHISAQTDLYQAHLDFFISSNHPDFKSTGLKKDSYIMPRIIDEPMSKFTPNARRGKLTANVSKDFEEWFGWK